jgi:hypothetical protein
MPEDFEKTVVKFFRELVTSLVRSVHVMCVNCDGPASAPCFREPLDGTWGKSERCIQNISLKS